ELGALRERYRQQEKALQEAEQATVRARAALDSLLQGRRSEERRVGKECRSRWSAHHTKKKTSQRLSAYRLMWSSSARRISLLGQQPGMVAFRIGNQCSIARSDRKRVS